MEFWSEVQRAASVEASDSSLVGWTDGPADAYRHIIGTAEMRRRFGNVIAYATVQGNEVWGTHVRDYPRPGRIMDEHNNEIGMRIGERAKTYEDVVRLARAAILDGFDRGGTGERRTPIWLSNASEPPGSDRSHATTAAPHRAGPLCQSINGGMTKQESAFASPG